MSKSEERTKAITEVISQTHLQTEVSKTALETVEKVSMKCIEANLSISKAYTDTLSKEMEMIAKDNERPDITADELAWNKDRSKQISMQMSEETTEARNSNERVAQGVREHSDETTKKHVQLLAGCAVLAAGGGYYALATKFNLPKPKIPKLK